MSPAELEQLKDSLYQSFSLLPENALVGLITFGKHVYIHELGFSECSKCYAFSSAGEELKDKNRMRELLGFFPNSKETVMSRFLVPVEDCEFVLMTVLEELERDDSSINAKMRPSRCTGFNSKFRFFRLI
ncbi:hypothetical protein MHBO_004205 [Bonamia ostreae]|uniref:Protein transport protein SEC23 n=1 Tax=Bonamia ostreae TaxID=126728 RepID=A0ABV2ASN3_9EUKA